MNLLQNTLNEVNSLPWLLGNRPKHEIILQIKRFFYDFVSNEK